MSESAAREILAIFDEERRTLSTPGFRKEMSDRVSRSMSEQSPWSWLDWSSHSPEEIDHVIEAEIARFSALGRNFEWKVYDHDSPSDLRQRLTTRGFQVGPAEAFLVLPIQEDLPPTNSSVDVRRVETLEQFEDYLAVEQSVWPADDGIGRTESRRRFIEHPNLEGYYVGYADGKPVASGRVMLRDGSRFAGLFGAGTLEAFRGRGIYSALIAARAAEARARGADYITADALPTSRPILERRGFRCLSHTYPCTWRVDQGH
jgi:GNAT superfamily N-acetyltransferase